MESLLSLLESELDVKSWLKEHAAHLYSFFKVKVADLLSKKKAENTYDSGGKEKTGEILDAYTIEGSLGSGKVMVLLSYHKDGLLVYVQDLAGKRALQKRLEENPDVFSLVLIKHSKIQGYGFPFLLAPSNAGDAMTLSYGEPEKPVKGV